MKMISNVERLQPLMLGRELDSDVSTVEIDCREWLALYPFLTEYRIEVTAPDGTVYFPANVTMKDGVLTWKITNEDTSTSGEGSYQVVATGANGERKTSGHPKLHIGSVMAGTASENPPDPAQPWVDKVVNAAETAQREAKRAEEIAQNMTGAIPVADELPEPKEDYRGMFLIVPEAGNDRLYICLRVNGIYKWAAI